jgi:hypothetical protein
MNHSNHNARLDDAVEVQVAFDETEKVFYVSDRRHKYFAAPTLSALRRKLEEYFRPELVSLIIRK